MTSIKPPPPFLQVAKPNRFPFKTTNLTTPGLKEDVPARTESARDEHFGDFVQLDHLGDLQTGRSANGANGEASGVTWLWVAPGDRPVDLPGRSSYMVDQGCRLD